MSDVLWSGRSVTGILAMEAAAALLTAVIAVDMSAHHRVEEARGPNARGFRGTARIKAVGAARVAVVGGSAAYGFGVDWRNSFPYYFEGTLNQGWRKNHPGTYTEVVNLAAVGDGAASYIATLTDYAYLAPDIICIYDGYAPAMASGTGGVRRSSVVFRRTGYLPILGDLLADPAPWEAPHRAVIDPVLRDDAGGDVSCNGASEAWCAAMLDTVRWAVSHGMKVLVVSPPQISPRHALRQASLADALGRRFPDDRRVHHVSVADEIDLVDATLSFDGVHLTARGNQRLSEVLVDDMFDLLARR